MDCFDKKPFMNENQETKDWREGYYAESFGEPYNKNKSDAWKAGYEASYKWFLKYGRGYIPMRKE